MSKKKDKILIADDSEMNRALLEEMLQNDFEIEEAENGKEVIALLRERASEFSLLLLDIVMPEMDGFEVLAFMNKYQWIEDVPVIMISSESSPSYIERAYDFGVTDYICRPFDAAVVKRRVFNTIMLYGKQKRLAAIVTEQIYEKEKSNSMMVFILSHIVEFRNGESGLHVLHINTMTELLLKQLIQKTDRYPLTKADISMISMASSLHDIGKISIPEQILNKPGRLTPEEFEIIKNHSLIGAQMLEDLPLHRGEALVQTAHDICRWHHERYDGGGYPDKLKGDEIPISAQIVALADVYDALTSKRCYKKAYTHEVAMQMIMEGQCGIFNPILLECLRDIEEVVQKELNVDSLSTHYKKSMDNVTAELMQHEDLATSERILRSLEQERIKVRFLSSASPDIVFTYTDSPSMISFPGKDAAKLGLNENIINPLEDPSFLSKISREQLQQLKQLIGKATHWEPRVQMDCQVKIDNVSRWHRFTCQTMWSSEEPPVYMGLVGRLEDVSEEYGKISHAVNPGESTDFMKVEQLMNFFQGKEITVEQAGILMKCLSIVFDTVRLIDSSLETCFCLNEERELISERGICYPLWEMIDKCENSISAKVLSCKSRLAKIEFIDERLYHVAATYIEVEGKPYSMEMAAEITDDTILGAYGSRELTDSIMRYNKKLYMDPLTDTNNRRYYEEQLVGLSDVDAVAILDIDNFKMINDSYGHHTGDLALKLVANAVLSCVRSSDEIIRYGGDEFVIVFRSIPENIFGERLENIRGKIREIFVADCPNVRFSASIGGYYGPGGTTELLKEADSLMYKAKRQKNSICLGRIMEGEKNHDNN